MSRGGGGGGGGGGAFGQSPEATPNNMMLREQKSQAEHSEFRLAKEREYERVQQKLYEEFK